MALPLRDPKTIYEEHIAPLSDDDKLRLLDLIREGMVRRRDQGGARLADLDGLGRDAWDGIDPDAYVRGIRDEWLGRFRPWPNLSLSPTRRGW